MSLLSYKGGEWERKEKPVGRWRLCLCTSGEEAVRNECGNTPMYRVSSLQGYTYFPAI
jgi:hypothetical protein